MKMTGRAAAVVDDGERDGCDPQATGSSATTRTSKKKGLVIADEALIPRFKRPAGRSERELDAESKRALTGVVAVRRPSGSQEVRIGCGRSRIRQLREGVDGVTGVLQSAVVV